MVILRKSEIEKMTGKDLLGKLNELKKELMKFNAQIATGTLPENPGKIREIKRTVARIKTFLKKSKGG